MKDYKNKIKSLSCLALGSLMLIGCSDDFLKPDPLVFIRPGNNIQYTAGLDAAFGFGRQTASRLLDKYKRYRPATSVDQRIYVLGHARCRKNGRPEYIHRHQRTFYSAGRLL